MKNATWYSLPIEIQERMLQCQEIENGFRDANVFKTSISDGFSWMDTVEKQDFWESILLKSNFDIFFERYPQEMVFPCVCWVSDFDPDSRDNKRVVFMEKCGFYLAWKRTANTIEEAESTVEVEAWQYATPVTNTLQITKAELCKKLGVEDIEIYE